MLSGEDVFFGCNDSAHLITAQTHQLEWPRIAPRFDRAATFDTNTIV
jgi:hypothetical protein